MQCQQMLYSEHRKQKPAFLQLKWTYTTISPKQSIPQPPNIRGFKVDNTHCKCSKKGQLDLGLSQKKLKYCPEECKKTAYISLVRCTMTPTRKQASIGSTESNDKQQDSLQETKCHEKKGVSPTCL